jgi:hypothetical protein
MRVERLEARACWQDPTQEVRRVREALRNGDESWGRWLDELQRGEAVIASLRVSAHVRHPDGSRDIAQAENHDLWLEVRTHPPMVEAQVHEVANKDCAVLAQRLQALGVTVTADDVVEMYMHVELSDDLLEMLQPHDESAGIESSTVRTGIGTETGADA